MGLGRFRALVVVWAVLSCSPAGWAQVTGVQPIATDQTVNALGTLPQVVGQVNTSVRNDRGDYAFTTGGDTPGALFYRGAAAGALTRVLQSGDPLPNNAGTRVDSFDQIFMNSSGVVAFDIQYRTSTGLRAAALLAYNGTTLQLLAKSGDSAPPSGSGMVFTGGDNYFNVVGIDTAGDVGFVTTVSTTAYPDTNTQTSSGLFVAQAAGLIVRVLGEGDAAPGISGGQVVYFNVPSSGPNGAMNSAGQIPVSASVIGTTGGNELLLASASGSVQKVAAIGDGVAGGATLTYPGPQGGALNNGGQVVFFATTSSNDQALWSWTAAAGIQRVAGNNDAAPAAIGGTLQMTYLPSPLLLNDNGVVAFNNPVIGSSVAPVGTTIIVSFRYTPAQPLESIAYSGQAAPGTSSTINSAYPFAIKIGRAHV